MANTTFVDNTTVIVAAWLQDINNFYYILFNSATTATAARTALGAAASGANTDITSLAGLTIAGSYTVTLASGISDERSIAHGLGTNDISWDLSLVGSGSFVSSQGIYSGSYIYSRGFANGSNVTNVGLFSSAPTTGEVRVKVLNSTGASQDITVYWTARKRA